MQLSTHVRMLSFLTRLTCREWQTPEKIREYQERKFRHVLTRARELPFYNKLFTRHHIDPESFVLADLSKIPILTKDLAREYLAEQVTPFRQGTPLQFTTTSGSSGTPLTIATTEQERTLTRQFGIYAFHASGLKWSDSICDIMVTKTEHLRDTTFLKKLGFGRYYALNLREEIPRTIAVLRDLRPNAIVTFPSYLLLLSNYLLETGNSLPSIRLVFTRGEVLTARARDLIGVAFQAVVRDIYGTYECGWLTFECALSNRHVIPDAAVIEVINQDKFGVGDVLITSLYREAMPFIRYLIGDRVQLSEEACGCGVPFTIVKSIQGRYDDFLVLPSGRRISARAINLLEDIPGIMEYKIIQKQPDYFEVHVRKNRHYTEQSTMQIHQIIKEGCLSEPIRIQVVFKETLHREQSGKLRSVVSEVVHRDDCVATS